MNMLVYDCSCQTARHKRSVSVVDVKGTFCTVEVQFCSCSPEFVRLLQFGLWGGTPTKPRIAFAIEFFELIHSVQMECKASIKSICHSFEEFNHNHIFSSYATPKMYPVIIDAFEEYRIYRHKLNMLSCVIPELEEGNICPTCSKECHGFLAGNAVRSMNCYRALDETAIFGLSYAVYVLQELEKDNVDNPALKINILYDVACMLVKHLQVIDQMRRFNERKRVIQDEFDALMRKKRAANAVSLLKEMKKRNRDLEHEKEEAIAAGAEKRT
ncbi:uncharacterized protein LOC124440922 [Xenia sp. Carnegie-2017]|uniref:uncharacterized protein LOC124440922 n=1 Tax=Xenia sp. Carnegie-2017 TaxID=2897299 RepID=UPI001F044F96|nr:uncharacterized protein LOC124440922 [Xenia sp. Carnegie-2017]